MCGKGRLTAHSSFLCGSLSDRPARNLFLDVLLPRWWCRYILCSVRIKHLDCIRIPAHILRLQIVHIQTPYVVSCLPIHPNCDLTIATFHETIEHRRRRFDELAIVAGNQPAFACVIHALALFGGKEQSAFKPLGCVR